MTLGALLTPLVEALALSWLVPRLSRSTHPATVTWIASLLALGAAVATLVGVGGTLLALVLPVLPASPLPDGLGAVPPGALATLLLVAVPVLVGTCAVVPASALALRDWVGAWAAFARVPATDGVVVLRDAAPEAYAVPVRRGLVVLHTGMLDALDPKERAVVLAHERAHLTRRHHLHLQATRLSACLNPLLRPVARTSVLEVERWADEVAAASVDDRAAAARAVARAALARSAAQEPVRAVPRASLGITAASGQAAGPAVQRVRALAEPPLPTRRPLLAGSALLAALLVALAVVQVHPVEDRFERQHAAAPATSLHR